MGLGKTYSTKYLLDSNNNSGVAGQVLISTSTGIDWSDGSAIIGGPYLPLSAGSTKPLSGVLYAGQGVKFTGGTIAQATAVLHTNNILYFRGGSSGFYLQNGDGSDGYYISPTYHKWEVNSSESMRLTSTGLGIGTTSPGTALQVGGLDDGSNYDITVGWNAVSSQAVGTKRSALTFKTSQTGVNNEDIYKWDIAMVTAPATASSEPFGSDLAFLRSTRSSTSVDETTMILTQLGNVGIGTTSPGSKLQVYSTALRDISIFGHGTQAQNNWQAEHAFFISAGQGVIIGKANASNNTNRLHLFYNTSNGDAQYMLHNTSSTNIVKLNTNGDSFFNGGNVGIGTTSPGAKLEVRSDGSAAGGAEIRLQHANNNTNDVVSTVNFANNAGSVGMIQAGTAGANNTGYIALFTDIAGSSSERMRVHTNGNVGIGTDSPLGKLMVRADTAGEPTRLIVSNNGTVQSGTSARLSFYEGTSEKGYIERRRDGSGKMAFYTPADDNPFVWENPSGEIMRITNSKVGIGTTSPTDPLTVTSTSNSLGIRLNYPVTNSLVYPFYVGNAAGTSYVRANNTAIAFKKNGGACTLKTEGSTNDLIIESASNLSFKTNGTLNTRMTILAAGNVGIGTTSPNSKLDVRQAVDGIALELHNTGGNVDDFVDIKMIAGNTTSGTLGTILRHQRDGSGGGDFSILTNPTLTGTPTEKLIVKSGGNVGIGTTNPTNKLHIQGSQATVYSSTDTGGQASAGTTINNTNTSGNTNNFSQLLFTVGTNNNSVSRIVAIRSGSDASDLAFVGKSTAGVAEYMRIKSGGNVGIGINNPSALLEVRKGSISGQIAKFSAINPHVVIESSTAGNAVLHLKPNATGSKSGQFKVTAGNGYNFLWSNDASGTGEIAYMDLDTSTTGGGDLTVKGDVIAYGSPSDKKYKENIKPIESALDKAMQLQGVTFDWKDSESILEIKEDIGFIAQDVQEVLPELVRDNGKGNLSLRYQGITPILLEAIKELKAEIEELKLNNCNCNK